MLLLSSLRPRRPRRSASRGGGGDGFSRGTSFGVGGVGPPMGLPLGRARAERREVGGDLGPTWDEDLGGLWFAATRAASAPPLSADRRRGGPTPDGASQADAMSEASSDSEDAALGATAWPPLSLCPGMPPPRSWAASPDSTSTERSLFFEEGLHGLVLWPEEIPRAMLPPVCPQDHGISRPRTVEELRDMVMTDRFGATPSDTVAVHNRIAAWRTAMALLPLPPHRAPARRVSVQARDEVLNLTSVQKRNGCDDPVVPASQAQRPQAVAPTRILMSL
eukprot:CAMPEP_0203907400 /NCGR_PEP_ID=MMETSP0359-20131031/48915_1 /ASSEMBLY_ACC=CAM_ASM_000338 /TAXON_ID=268821 /ORGANISM="Scrippsiella Hangoei, Strain SHTV-5" /LENGTH=277 /DNA_ID=CAMNT_0050832209 /DNA_START=32 /DNA_END=865 /DNA_ORIENTATION=-